MKLFSNFRKKSLPITLKTPEDQTPMSRIPTQYRTTVIDIFRTLWMAMGYKPTYDKVDGLTLFSSLAEAFFPIDFIASRIAGAHFEIKKVSDDSIVWCTGRSAKTQKLAKILSRPNCLQSWSEFVYMHFVHKLATGNGFIRAAMAESVGPDKPKWFWCDNFWAVPTPLVQIQTKGELVSLFGIQELDDVIKGYVIGQNTSLRQTVPSWQIWHDKDGLPNFGGTEGTLLMASSRLVPAFMNCSTLRKVYDARNTIYSKCGALGIITNKTSDPAGHVAMKPSDKREIEQNYLDNHGVTDGKSPVLVSDNDLGWLNIGMSIAQLQPFEETLLDAIVIAGQYGIPDVLVPRKDHSTFNNQSTAEKGVYSSVIIPMAKKFCQELTEFLGCEREGYYIDCNFDFVDCLQVGMKEAEDVKKLVNDRCRQQFLDGLISFNDWRAQIHESALTGEVFGKTKFEMTDEELSFISRVIGNHNTNLNPQQENGKDNEESAIADESE